MQVHTFIADSAADAVAQIRAQLGSQAVVLNVRPLSGEGLSRLWQKKRIEVLACLPEPALVASAPPTQEKLADIYRGSALSKPETPADELVPNSAPEPARSPFLQESLGSRSGRAVDEPGRALPDAKSGQWRIGTILENSGLQPMHAQRIVEDLRTRHGEGPPPSLARELEWAKALLRELWFKGRPARGEQGGVHVFVGAPGVGKTVCLCKWLAHQVLIGGAAAQVWRLDGRTANTAEGLSVYAEILGTPVARSIPAEPLDPAPDLLFIDLPGVSWTDPEGLADLARRLEGLPPGRVHLVLNAAYESSILLAQARAFGALPISDVIFTHLDEETRWGKLWNLVLGTNFAVSHLSAGQNVPGDWVLAEPDAVLSRQFVGR